MKNKSVFTGSKWEEFAGYCRARRVGDRIVVAGTTAVKNGEVIGVNNPYEQAKYILSVIEESVEKLGGSMSDVILTRMYVTDINNWQEVSRAHGEYFKDIFPVCTLVEIKGLIQPELLVEIEAEAVVGQEKR